MRALFSLALVAVTLARTLSAGLPLLTTTVSRLDLNLLGATLSAGSACSAGLSLLAGSGAEGVGLVAGLGWLSTLLVLGRKQLLVPSRQRPAQRHNTLMIAGAAVLSLLLALHGGSTLLELRSATAATTPSKTPQPRAPPERRMASWRRDATDAALGVSRLPHRTAWQCLVSHKHSAVAFVLWVYFDRIASGVAA